MTFDGMLVLTQIMKFGFDIGFKVEMFINSNLTWMKYCLQSVIPMIRNNECWQNLKKYTFFSNYYLPLHKYVNAIYGDFKKIYNYMQNIGYNEIQRDLPSANKLACNLPHITIAPCI